MMNVRDLYPAGLDDQSAVAAAQAPGGRALKQIDRVIALIVNHAVARGRLEDAPRALLDEAVTLRGFVAAGRPKRRHKSLAGELRADLKDRARGLRSLDADLRDLVDLACSLR